jgi:hypothetical protein
LSIISWFTRRIKEENRIIKIRIFSMLKKEKLLIFKNKFIRKYKEEIMAVKIKAKLPSFISPLLEKG